MRCIAPHSVPYRAHCCPACVESLLTRLIASVCIVGFFCCWSLAKSDAADGLRIATFDIDASPAIGSPLAYDPTKEITSPLSCRGVILLGAGKPIILCAVDWIGIANESNVTLRKQLASAADTTFERVVVHTLHQHDAPRCDHEAAMYLKEINQEKKHFDIPFIDAVFARAATAVREALPRAKPFDGIGYGQAKVEQVASNRRMLDSNGKVVITRYTACRDEAIRNLPEGVIDPWLRVLTFFNGSQAVARLSFYATHPQSYYRTGGANPDFPGMARNAFEQSSGVTLVHFNGAGGNVGAGKYNDGSIAMRQTLADRVEAGIKAASQSTERQIIKASDIDWTFENVSLPIADHMNEAELDKQLKDPASTDVQRVNSADKLSFLRRAKRKATIQISCLKLGSSSVLFMPGELFVEYQLAAAYMQPERKIIMAAYGDYGPGYIGTRAAYPQGGYEVSPGASNVSSEVEAVLLSAMGKLLGVPNTTVKASDFTDTSGPGLPKSTPKTTTE